MTLAPRSALRRCLLAAAGLLTVQAFAQTPPAPVRLRGTIEALSETQLVLKDRGGQRVELALPANLAVTEMFPVRLTDVREGVFVGVGAMPQADGTQRAIAVLLFPEAMRGTGEGHRPFDFLPQSTMTNATVAGTASAPDGERLQLRYPGGEKTIVVPAGTPIVSIKPGDRALLAVGKGVSLTAQEVGGRPTATRITAGRDGFTPPY